MTSLWSGWLTMFGHTLELYGIAKRKYSDSIAGSGESDKGDEEVEDEPDL